MKLTIFKKNKSATLPWVRGVQSLFLLVFIIGYSVNCFAQGNLLVTPRRVVFEGNKRAEELSLANTGKDSATYVISFVQYKMNEDGSFARITEPEPGQFFADKYLRFFPRTVTLGPNEVQTVKLQYMRPATLEPGEYRSHIFLRAIPNADPLGEPQKNDSGVSVKLTPIFGLTVPAIIRVGDLDSKAEFSDISVTFDSVPFFSININRFGKHSVYGDLRLEYHSPTGEVTTIGAAKGLAVYTPLAKRNVKFRLDIPGLDLHRGKLRIVYADHVSPNKILAQDDWVLK